MQHCNITYHFFLVSQSLLERPLQIATGGRFALIQISGIELNLVGIRRIMRGCPSAIGEEVHISKVQPFSGGGKNNF